MKEFKGFNEWRQRIDKITFILFAIGAALMLAAYVGWKYHLNNAATVFFVAAMICLGAVQFLMLRYIGMPSDEDVEKLSPGWMKLIQKS
jgi:VIT1/CCC1 family predicted Fe2+/Mn2+ transporter